MAKLSKEVYEYKELWRDSHNKDQLDNDSISQAEHEYIADMQRIRHEVHCEVHKGSTNNTDNYDKLVNHINSYDKSWWLSKPPSIPEGENIVMTEDFYFGLYDSREALESAWLEQRECVNDLIREWLDNNNNKFGLNY